MIEQKKRPRAPGTEVLKYERKRFKGIKKSFIQTD